MEKLMQGVFKYKIKLAGHNCSMNNTIKLSSLMKEIQQIGTVHLDELGITYKMLLSEGVVFVLSKVALKINRMPFVNEELVVTTTPQGVKGASMLRKIQIGTTNGELLVDCQSAWLIINPVDRKILRPKMFTHTLPFDANEPDNIHVTDISINIPEETEQIYTKKVRYTDMDLNNHMNNTIYGDIVMDAVPFEVASKQEISTFIIHYRKEALFNQDIQVVRSNLNTNSFYIGGNIENQPCFSCNISFK